MNTIENMVSEVIEHLGATATSGAVAGKPIEIGEVTIVVLSSVSVGMGAGGGEGEGNGAQVKSKRGAPGGGNGEGAGGGAKVRPAAVIAFTPRGVEVLPIPDRAGVFEKVIDRIPQVAEMVEKVRKSFAEA